MVGQVRYTVQSAVGQLGRLECSNKSVSGKFFTFQLARSMCLLTAAAIGVQAIDTVHAAFRDLVGLQRSATQARRDGFLGKLAIHPDQVAPINAAFTPTAAEIEHARRVVEIFEQGQDIGVASLDGRMPDKPHLILAR